MAAKYLAGMWLGFLIGVAVGSWFELDRALIFITISAALAMVGTGVATGNGKVTIFVIAGLVLGAWYIQQSFGPSEYQDYFGQDIDREGVIVVDTPNVDRNQQVTIRPDGFDQSVRASIYQPIKAVAGDRVWIRGVIQPPENFDDFDYIGYLQRYKVYAVLKKPHVIVIKRAPPNWRTPLVTTKTWLIRKSKTRFDARSGSLIMGMLIGGRSNLPQDVTEAFARTGLSHVVAVSGFNMTILATACASLAWYFGRRLTNYATVVMIISFVIITGASASVIRAAIMALLVVGAQLTGRLYTSSYALLCAAGLMVLQNPRILAWDIGFQLSVAATIGVLTAYWLQGPRPQSFIKSLLLPTIGAIIATAPLLVFYFQTLSLVAPLANGLLLPLVPWLMLIGALSLLPLIGSGMAILATLLAKIFLGIVTYFASWSFASVEMHISATAILIYYLLLIGLLLLIRYWRGVVKV